MADPVYFDPSPYMRPPRLDVAKGIALAIGLLTAVPKPAKLGKDAASGVQRTAKELRSKTVALQTIWRAKKKAESAAKPQNKVVVDTRCDRAWGGLKRRLDDYAELPATSVPGAVRAGEISKALFPQGMGWLAGEMPAQWAIGEEILTRIDADGLAADLNKYAGPEFLTEVRDAHKLYGAVLGITEALAPNEEVDGLLEPLRDLMQAMSDYLIQLVATIDRSKPETVTTFKAAVLPLDKAKVAAARRAAAKGGKDDAPEEDATDGEDTAPVPEVPV